ncbi:MAG: hypothetical protein M9894_22265 [Planctomycetes bacterium]|nr:hypothetical protein [Planctomycetota bacterium]
MSARAALGAALAVGYPALVYAGVSRGDARAAALVLLAGLLVTVRGAGPALALPLAAGALAAGCAATGDARLLLALPVVVNVLLLTGFLASLRGESVVERLARLLEPDLPAERAAYCRRVTWVWCAFFAANAAVAGALALLAPVAWWALWTGVLSYAAVGLLFVGEVVVRRRRFPDAPGLAATIALRRRSAA